MIISGVFFWWAREPCVRVAIELPSSWLSGCIFSIHYIMPYIFVRCPMSYLDGRDAFDGSYSPRHRKPTFIDFQLAKEGNDQKLSVELTAIKNLSGSLCVHNHEFYDPNEKQAKYQTYECNFPPHVVLNELDVCAGYKVMAANTTKETFVWTLYKPWNYRRAATMCNGSVKVCMGKLRTLQTEQNLSWNVCF